MELFIQKMEALLPKKAFYFKITLLFAWLIGGLFFFSPILLFWKNIEKDYIILYIKIGAWMIFVALILGIILLWSEAEKKIIKWKFEQFLKKQNNHPFTRHDLAAFIYDTEIETTDNRYKGLGAILRSAQNEWIITETNPGKNPRIYIKL